MIFSVLKRAYSDFHTQQEEIQVSYMNNNGLGMFQVQKYCILLCLDPLPIHWNIQCHHRSLILYSGKHFSSPSSIFVHNNKLRLICRYLFTFLYRVAE